MRQRYLDLALLLPNRNCWGDEEIGTARIRGLVGLGERWGSKNRTLCVLRFEEGGKMNRDGGG